MSVDRRDLGRFREPSSIERVFAQHYPEFTEKQRAIADFLLGNLSVVAFATVEEVARRTEVDQSTIVRFAQNLGFRGFPELRLALRKLFLSQLQTGSDELSQERKRRPDYAPELRPLLLDIQNLQAAVSQVDVEAMRQLAEALVSSRRVLAIGSGTHAALATVLAHLCSIMGRRIEIEDRLGPYLAAALNALGPSDLLLAVGFLRHSTQVINGVEWARRKGIKTAAITDNVMSPLGRLAEIVISCPVSSTSFFPSLTAALSCVYALVCLVADMMPTSEEGIVKYLQLVEEFGMVQT